ncbi:MAG TPA: MEDS domain-containing protein [Polyangia bacterium]|jgi:hypothetical protein|nr:MEDS domain-containing protein [Polyangia bacterium]
MQPTPVTPGRLKACSHLCCLFHSIDEKHRTVAAFVAEGLERSERCVLIASPAEQRELHAALEAAGVSVESARGRGALVLATDAETYLRMGRFDPEDSLSLMEGFVDGAVADGFRGVRVSGDGSSPLPDHVWADVLRYEALVNERLARRPFLGLCRFDAEAVRPDRLEDVLRTHPLVAARGELCANPFYERPEVVLGADPRARVQWRLHQVRAYHRAMKKVAARATGAALPPGR